MPTTPAARLKDPHTCPNSGGGEIIEGAATVFINSRPAAVVGSACKCADGPSYVGSGSPTVLIEGAKAARVGDSTCHHGVISEGADRVLIGDAAGGSAMHRARTTASPFLA